MAEKDSSQEKTEEPTEKRKQDSRKKGQVARSRELGTAVVMMAGAISLLFVGHPIVDSITKLFKQNYILTRAQIYSSDSGPNMLISGWHEVFISMIPIFAILFVASILGPGMVGGFFFSTDSIKPKLSKLNPVEGMKKIFSVKGLMEMVKAFAKFLVVLGTSMVLIYLFSPKIVDLAKQDLDAAILNGSHIAAWCFLILCSSLLLIAAIDVPFQIFQHNKQLKMTKQEVKDEMKDSEGKPEVKSRIRQMQMEIAQRRMMSDVPTADVVITNPTHFSVALKYNDFMAAPVVVAKGVDQIALKIREIAVENDVVIVEAPPLARAVYHTAAIGSEIHEDLYVSVAQILAYVYQLNLYTAGEGPLPDEVVDFDIPNNMQFDEDGNEIE
ncbi:MAG: flagellar biosynthesis protein FlhB [Pseudomonadales bacterium]|nr:flagellar biosynthesis protein FlhB [Pseudomonadales bacterium]